MFLENSAAGALSFMGLSPAHYKFIAGGIFVTLKYSLLAIIFGSLIGVILTAAKFSGRKPLIYLAEAYSSIFRGTPLLVQLSIIYFAPNGLLGLTPSPLAAGVAAFSLNSGAYVSEIIRSGINSVDSGQMEAAKALGLPYFAAMRDIILPQALRNVIPALVNEFINLIKESAIISVISVEDLMRRSKEVSLETANYFTPLLFAGLIYYVCILILAMLARKIENKLAL
jgi:polar amino acid transport system permease protein